MIWMSWRQFRAQALVGVAALVVFAGYLLWLGTRIRDSRDGYLGRCRPHGDCAPAMGQFVAEHQNTLLVLVGLLGLLPGILGMFWGRRSSPGNSTPAPTGWCGTRASPAAAGC
ncbi:hypothetical protein [Plantactinospora veratri]